MNLFIIFKLTEFLLGFLTSYCIISNWTGLVIDITLSYTLQVYAMVNFVALAFLFFVCFASEIRSAGKWVFYCNEANY